MNNKTLAVFGLIPVVTSFLLGFMEGFTGEVIAGDSFYIFVGIMVVVFVPWGLVRLYRTK